MSRFLIRCENLSTNCILRPKMRSNSLFFIEFFVVLINLFAFINCFNIDTEFPVVFSSPHNHKSDNYFGLSVQLQTSGNEQNEIVVIIGSPKTNSTLYNVRESGTVFRCRLRPHDKTDCNEINLNYEGMSTYNRNPGKRIEVKPTNDMFLGGNIIARPNSAQVAVCAHKWSHEIGVNTPQHQINPSGSCYVVDLSNPRSTPLGIFPLTDINPSQSKQFRQNTYYFSHSMAGLSAAFTDKGEHLLLGAPGFFQWRGTFLETNSLNSRPNQLIEEQFVLESIRYQSNSESLAGYSIVSGHFFSSIQDSVAVGAPRDQNYRGKVFIYNLRNGVHSEHTTTLMSTQINGIQIGEYFGATLLSINLNSDSYSDLIVGAPLHSTHYSSDSGLVYVYLSNGKGFSSPILLSGSDSSNARFGTSLADLGDINKDGFNDLAVGAPYEDQNGVVYIYFGTKTGVDKQYSQRISAKKDFKHLNFKGFGISISGDKDIDSNYYNDLVIGSYLSNNAVILRSKPIVSIDAKIDFNSSFININDKNCEYIEPNTRIRRKTACVRLNYCVGYAGSNVPTKLKLNLTLQMDTKKEENPRCFTIYDNQFKTKLSKIQDIDRNKDFCFDELVVYLKNTSLIDDIFTPIEFSLSYSIIQLQPKNSFCKDCPTIGAKRKTHNKLHFKTGCKTDERCVSTLKLMTKTLVNGISHKKDDSIFEGFHKNLTLITSVLNTGEPSYLTKILIKTNPRLNLIKQDIRCSIIKQTLKQNNIIEEIESIECDVGNPLNPNLSEELSIFFDVSDLDYITDSIDIDLEVKTASEVTKDSHLFENIEINVIRNASLEIFGSSNISEFIYESESQRKSDSIPFTGIFQITKQNWSSIETVLIEIEIPSLFNKQTLIFQPIVDQPIYAHNRGVPVYCNRTISTLPPLPEKLRHKRDAENSGKSLKLDCKSHINCETMQCFSGPFVNERSTAKFFIHSALNIKNIESIFGQKYDKIELNVKTKVTVLDTKINSNSNQISTVFLFRRLDLTKDSIEIWVYLVSIGTGLLILIIIAVILYKLGFFNRNKFDSEDKNGSETQTDNKIENNSLLDFENDGQQTDPEQQQ